MKKSLFFSMAVLVLNLIPCFSHGKSWKNAYVAFEMPDSWGCKLESTEWNCHSDDPRKAKEAVIILTAKEVGPTDSFEQYEQYLKTKKTIQSSQGSRTSDIVYTPKKYNINDHLWIDGLHLNSEIPGYYTRYLATIKDQLAILVTLTAHKRYYTSYSSDFIRVVQSLRVIATKNTMSALEGPLDGAGSAEQLGNGFDSQGISGDQVLAEDPMSKKQKSSDHPILLLMGLILIAISYYLYKQLKK